MNNKPYRWQAHWRRHLDTAAWVQPGKYGVGWVGRPGKAGKLLGSMGDHASLPPRMAMWGIPHPLTMLTLVQSTLAGRIVTGCSLPRGVCIFLRSS